MANVVADQAVSEIPNASEAPAPHQATDATHPLCIKLEQFLKFSDATMQDPTANPLIEAIISFEGLVNENMFQQESSQIFASPKEISFPKPSSHKSPKVSTGPGDSLKRNRSESILGPKVSGISQFQLKRTLEMCTQNNYRKYLAQLKGLDQHIQAIEAPIRDPAQKLLKELKDVELKRSAVQKHLDEVEKFLKDYTLAPSEAMYLRDWDIPVDLRFVELMERLKTLEAKMVKLVSQGFGEILGQDILNGLVACREEANYRLVNYLEEHLFLLDVATPALESEGGQLLCLAAKTLSHNPTLLTTWLEQAAQVRHKHLGHAFEAALTRGNPSTGNMRPIDLSASDSLRYVGDMLAWIHQALVEEKDSLDALLSGSPGSAISDETLEQITQALDAIFSSALMLLKGRVYHVLENLHGPTLAFQIANLIQFYHHLLAKTVAQGEVHSTLNQMTDYAHECFYQILEDDMAQLLSQADIPPADLSVPESITSTIDDLKRILEINKASYNPSSEHRLVDGILNPLIQFCEREASFVAENERAIYVTNCLTFIQQSLKDFPAAQHYLERLDDIIRLNLEQLLELQYNALLKVAGLDRIMPLADSYHELLEGIVTSQGEEMSVQDLVQLCLDQHLDNIAAGLLSLEQFLYTVDLDQDFTSGEYSSYQADDGDVVGLKRLLLPPREIWKLRSQALKHLLSCYGLLYPLLDKVMAAASKLPTDEDSSQLSCLKKLRLRPVTELETLLYTPDL
ncbi:Golgi transport complex subunit 6, variant 2 [Entomophthora muscae]|uniref:Golgi transport complex subunit 6, variant 2 n=1 Tax=Entomophthora muscae TaxID=34485 RepID=A0ACC2S7C2_9FUNG|nr:Golgi transport complex subunit 6, variant 2 [Entomophthora muscae]